ncbi:MAG: VPLPA-CTERM sorting domain-containing protein [Paracoccaceae bacterium]|nr:VPLPA-CTERM sorting domain-containing protein [Paracoccaceae bacterium]
MLKSAFPAICLTIAAAIASPSSAATFNNVKGVVIEGGVAPAASAPPPGLKIGDFNSAPGNPLLNVVGDTQIYGGVAHRFPGEYTDAWAMDFGTNVYDIVFNWVKKSRDFDGQILVNGVSTELSESGSLSLGRYTGLVTFDVDPIYGLFSPTRSNGRSHEVATWDLQVSTVPLPAGVVLMLSVLAGFGIMRRRKAS